MVGGVDIMRIKKYMKEHVPIEIQRILYLIRGKLTLESLEYVITRPCRVKRNKVVFCNVWGNGFGDNPKYIALELIKYNKFDIVWLTKDMNDFSIPNGIRKVQYGSFQAVKELATAKVWVDNARKSMATIKRKNQYYILTGHGGMSLKRVEADAPAESLGMWYLTMAQHDSKQFDLMISNSMIKTSICKHSYWYDGEVAEWGSPKIEALKKVDKALEKNVKSKYDVDEKCQIALYAPTFRNNTQNLNFMIKDYKSLQNALRKKFGGDWKIFVRLHPNWTSLDKNLKIDSDCMINVTQHSDMQELLTFSSVLITDYSGTMFEMMQIEKPVFLFAPDKDEYDRGFYFNMEELPFQVSQKQQELLENILDFSEQKYLEKISEFKKKIGLIEEYGAAKKCAERIYEVAFGEK